MHYVDHATADLTDPLKPQFRPRDDVNGFVGTRVTADWLNDTCNNLMKAVTAAGIVPTKLREEDLVDAIVRLAAGRDATRSKLDKDVAGGAAEIVLTDAEAGSPMTILAGARTGDLLLSWPDSYVGPRWVYNGTTGGFAITARVSTQPAGEAIELPVDQWSLVTLDGTSLAVLLSTAGTGAEVPTGQAIEQGLHTIWVPASAMTPRPANSPGIGVFTSAGTSATYPYLAFDPASDEAVDFTVAMPKSWNRGPIKVELVWFHPATAGPFAIQFIIASAVIGNGDTLDAALGVGIGINDAGGTADTLYISPVTADVVAPGVAEVGDALHLFLRRDPNDGSDTLPVDANVLGLRVLYNISAATDA